MGELLKEFLRQTISNLQILQKDALGKHRYSEEFLRRFFRQLHTIKGTSNTFNLNILAHFAHEIEYLLQAIRSNEISQTAETSRVLNACFEELLRIAQNYLDELDVTYPTELADRIKRILSDSRMNFGEDLLISQIPKNIISQLSSLEKSNLSTALRNGRNFYLIEAVFQIQEFAAEFKKLRDGLGENSEVIAVSSGTAEDPDREICIQLLCVTDLQRTSFEQTIRYERIRFVFETSPNSLNSDDDLTGMLANLIAESEQIARVLDKNVIFETSLEIGRLPNEFLILLHQTISHLLHNAIDHAIETSRERIDQGKNSVAKIKIKVSVADSSLLVQVIDDGRGIDLRRTTDIARQKGLIDPEKILTENEARELIFLPGFTTSETVSEISGRGVGLDAVGEMVAKAGGRIEFTTSIGGGTTFSVYFPYS